MKPTRRAFLEVAIQALACLPFLDAAVPLHGRFAAAIWNDQFFAGESVNIDFPATFSKSGEVERIIVFDNCSFCGKPAVIEKVWRVEERAGVHTEGHVECFPVEHS